MDVSKLVEQQADIVSRLQRFMLEGSAPTRDEVQNLALAVDKFVTLLNYHAAVRTKSEAVP